MTEMNKPEVWLRGPVANIPVLLQPVAHALLQAREEVNKILVNFPENHLWSKPAGVASVGFHLQHLKGVLERLFTYAQGQALNEQQLNALSLEGKPGENNIMLQELVQLFNQQVDKALEQLHFTNEQILNEPRGVGRAKLPSTVLGLLVHAAEHTMRHVGQLSVTVRVIKSSL
ncbi:DinB family protein [Segetibacter koreensis]|uniref:DinB family protein n=1 Tax=Segetibacter koreensis TaxID=398037 RepID=UPI00035EB9AF|nr:DinB family protein [Segetibacter koreensis]